MVGTLRTILTVTAVLCLQEVVSQETSSTLGSFVQQLTSLISQNGGIGSLVNAIRPPGQNPGGHEVLAAGDGGFGLYPEGAYRPEHPQQYPEYPQQYPDYRPPYPSQNPDYRPPYPQQYPGTYPPGYDPYRPHPGYPQPGLMAALESITRYDDQRCVPRLLCEVTSGGKPGYPVSDNSQQQATKQAITTLLTVLNFMDNNPLFVFGRAALLGAASRGNSESCLNAYPTCPRDPERLVHYLNNHNGGFFRFFGGSPAQVFNEGRGQEVAPADGEARIQNKGPRGLFQRPSDSFDYLSPSAHRGTGGGKLVFPDVRGSKQLSFPDEGLSNPGSAYKPDYSPPQNLINFRDQRSVKFPAPMNFPRT